MGKEVSEDKVATMKSCKDIVPKIKRCYHCYFEEDFPANCDIVRYCIQTLNKRSRQYYVRYTDNFNIWFLQAIELMKDNPKSWAKEWGKKREVAQLLR